MDEELNGQVTDQMEESAAPETQESSDQQQSTETPSVDPRDEELNILRTVAKNAAQQTMQLRQRMDELTARLTPKQEEPQITDDDFREAPARSMETMLERKMSKLMAPINAEAENIRRERMFTSNFNSVVSAIDPNLASYAEVLAPRVRNVLGDVEATPQAIQFATLAVLGQMSLEMRNTPKEEAPARREVANARPVVPANAPSNTPRQSAAPKSKVQLTESQRKYMENLGFKPGQEDAYMSFLQADEVNF